MKRYFSLACQFNFPALIIILRGFQFGASNETTQVQQCDGLNFTVLNRFQYTDYANVTLLSPANCDQHTTGVMEITSIPNISSYLHLELERIKLNWNSQPLLMSNLKTIKFTNCKLNPHSIQFTENLKSLRMFETQLINGTLGDLLTTASQIEELELEGMSYENEIEDLPILLKSLIRLELRGGRSDDAHKVLQFRCSESLDSLYLEGLDITDGNFRTLLESASQLSEVTLHSVQVLIGLNNLASADFFQSQINQNSTAFGKRNVTESEDQPIFLKSLERLHLRGGWPVAKHNPLPFRFSDSLDYIQLYEMNITNRNLRSLIESATQLREFSLSWVQVLEYDSLGTKQVGLDKLANADLTRSTINPKSIVLGKENKTTMEDPPIFLKSLKMFDLHGGWPDHRHTSFPFRFSNSLRSLDLHKMSITVGDLRGLFESATQLREVTLWSVHVLESDSSVTKQLGLDNQGSADRVRSRNNPNSILFDLLRHVIGLETLRIISMGEVDLASLPSSKLIHLDIWDSRTHKTAPVTFDELKSLRVYSTASHPYIFDDFDNMFPKIEFASTGTYLLLSPSSVLALFRSSATKLQFTFDFEPQIKTFEFGEVMRVLRNAGLERIDDSGNAYPEYENRVGQTRARYVTFIKTNTENGTQKWERNGELTNVYDGTVQDVKPPEGKLNVYIYVVIQSILICIGIFGNILSTTILVRRKSKNSAEIILLSLTLYDGLVILTYFRSLFFNARLFFRTFVESGTKSEYFDTDEYSWIAEQNPVQAFLVYPLNRTGYTGSVYSTVLISLERFVAICWPLKAKRLLRPTNSKRAIFFICLFSTLINIPRWIEAYEWNYYDDNSLLWNEYYKPTLMRMQSYRTIYHGYLWTILMYILPFLLVGYFNFKILQHITILRSRGSVQQTNVTSASVTDSVGITEMLLCVVGVFVLCNALHIGIVVYFFTNYQYIELSTIEAISCFPVIVNSSFKFLIYILLGKTLSAEFMKLIPQCVRIYLDKEKIMETPGANIPMDTINSARSVTM